MTDESKTLVVEALRTLWDEGFILTPGGVVDRTGTFGQVLADREANNLFSPVYLAFLFNSAAQLAAMANKSSRLRYQPLAFKLKCKLQRWCGQTYGDTLADMPISTGAFYLMMMLAGFEHRVTAPQLRFKFEIREDPDHRRRPRSRSPQRTIEQ